MAFQAGHWYKFPTVAGWQLDSLGHNIRELSSGCDLLKDHVSILDGLMGEVLANVNVLGSLTAADDVVSPLN